ncbi:beta-1,6-N-acetylglucosaminyltransferase [Paenibacillus gallinarum]|uniref:beta-1,6-N-acetylglucosaminyltransferase n=1 Tax=Paenibacillus gallinarum TaxID=2762232 RepID=UPI00296B12DE|nr:beta-1,6-N-acetylglucosaminyltransferase [Paenibacillus gallinarum]
MLAHNDHKHFGRMVNMLNYKADFYVHIDKKTSEIDFQSEVTHLTNVLFLEERYPIYWAGFNVIKATIALLKRCISSGVKYKKIVLLSGSDYPLVSNIQIHDFFDLYPEIEFIRASKISDSNSKHHRNHILRYFFMDINIKNNFLYKVITKMITTLNGCIPIHKKLFIEMGKQRFDVYMGSQWWAITQECAEDLLKMIREYPRIDTYFKYSFAPDEKYFHTLIYNSMYKNRTFLGKEEPFLIRDYKWPIWPNIHHIHPSLQKWYTLNDLDEVLSSDKLFIRKVNTFDSSSLLDSIDKQIKQTENKFANA